MERTACKFCKSKSSAAQKLNEEEICMMGDNCAVAKFDSGDIIVKEEALSTNIAYIKSGLVKIHTKGPIRERIMQIVKAPAYLCLPSSLGDKINYFSATALESTSVCFIDATVFKKFIYENGDFAFQIILDMSKAQLQNFRSCLNNSQKQNIGRVADAILFFAEQIYQANEFTFPISRQDLADLTEITRESASRILTDLNDDRVIEIKGRKIRILNEKLLRQISEKG